MNKLLLLCLSLTLFSCTAFEKQFIDVDDTLVVKGGQTKKEILDLLGKPTAVKEGIVMEEGDVFEIWRYVTKEGKNEVQSLLLPRKPPKQMDFEDWDKSDDFYVMFKNNLVIRWGDLTIDWKDPNACCG